MFKKTILVPEGNLCEGMLCVNCDLRLINNCKEFAGILSMEHKTCTEGAWPTVTYEDLVDVVQDLLEANKKIEKLEKEVFKEASIANLKDSETKIVYRFKSKGRVLYVPPFIKGVEYVGME